MCKLLFIYVGNGNIPVPYRNDTGRITSIPVFIIMVFSFGTHWFWYFCTGDIVPS
ncbi:hypothetical protein HanIR_Chr02g0095911 [Helianthus annuus]|nr:hypothetical protein HanIR_Chr02g0095911 [Helianthus annuus]